MKALEELNEAQRQAVKAGASRVMILAGPGTGKTKTLVARVAWLLDQRVKPGEILALTFTHKAAKEMRDRVQVLMGESVGAERLPEITTFHGFGYGLLQRTGGRDTREFVSEEERRAIIRELKRPAELRSLSVRELGLRLSRHRNGAPEGEAVAELAKQYSEALRQRGRRDFDELLHETDECLRARPESAGYRHVMVDEFQDTSEIQYRLAMWLAREGALFVIGDPNQAIYGFRGAGSEVFERFARDAPDCLQVRLADNYRSAPAVVAVGNAVFGPESALTARSAAGGQVRSVECLSEYAEADWLVGELERELGGTDLLRAGSAVAQARRGFRDFAVVYRTHQIGRALRRRMEDSGIPYQMVGGGSWYEQREIARLISALRVLNGEAVGDWIEGEQELLRTKQAGQAGVAPVTELVGNLTPVLGLGATDEARRDLRQFNGAVLRFGTDLGACLAYLAELAASDFYDPVAEAVTLLTIHAAKGLEFAHVFVCGCEEGLMPHARVAENPAGLEEERRLFYVAATRAKERLDISFARERGGRKAAPSRFLEGLPVERSVDEAMAAQMRRRVKSRLKRAQGKLF